MKRSGPGRRHGVPMLLVAALLALAPVAAGDEGLGSRQSAQLTILHLADVYEMSPVDGGKVGGLARVAALAKQLEAEKGRVLVTIAGDFMSPSVASSIFEGEQMVAALGAMGLDLATLGNHEFDFQAITLVHGIADLDPAARTVQRILDLTVPVCVVEEINREVFEDDLLAAILD